MSNKKSAPMVGQRSKVSAIRPPANEIEPHEGWVLQSEFGFMGRDNTPAGRLVRLVDLEEWLSVRKGIPRAEASRLIADVMRDRPEAIEHSLFQLQPKDYAQPLRPKPQAPAESQKPAKNSIGIKLPTGGHAVAVASSSLRASAVEMAESAKLHSISDIDGAALLRMVEEDHRMAVLAQPVSLPFAAAQRNAADYLAILMTTANELWGYGRVAAHSAETAGVASTPEDTVPDVSTWDGLVDCLRESPGCEWKPEMLKTIAREHAKRGNKPGEKSVSKQLAGELPNKDKNGLLGVSEALVNKRVRDGKVLLETEEREQKKANSSVFNRG